MSRLPDAPICDRGNDLISFLYGEIEELAAPDFEQHLLNCADCKAEFSAFKHVRSSVVAWRQESLGGAAISVARDVERASDPGKPSAIAAIRKFFEFSPLWLKGAMAFASVLFCAVSILALALLFETPESVNIAVEKRYTEEELQAKIAAALRSQQAGETQVRKTVPEADNSSLQITLPRRGTNGLTQRVATNSKSRRGPLTKSEREQLAADLRLTVGPDDSDLDLLEDGNNQ